MPERLYLCVLPGERASLAGAVHAAGGVAVLDLTSGPTVSVPDGAWVRVRTRRSVPGKGPVILTGNHKSPVRNRETWLEVTEIQAAPEGFAGVVLRGQEAGGPCASVPGMDLLAGMGQDQKVILDAGVDPEEAAAALAAGAQGVVLSDVLLGLPELDLPAGLKSRLSLLDAGAFHIVNGFQIVSSPLSPVLRRLLDGEGFWSLADGWFAAGDPSKTVWPAGSGLRHAQPLAEAYGTIAGVLGAYKSASQRPAAPVVSRPVSSASAVADSETVESVAVIGLGCCLPGALNVPEFWDNLLNGRNSISEVPTERWDWRLFWDEDKTVPDKTYAKIGGFLRGFKFNSRKFRIPPNVAKQVAVVQQITLESVSEALDDAGYGKDREYDRSRVGVILGNSMGGEVTDDYVVRTRFPAMAKALRESPGFSNLPEAEQERILTDFEAALKGPLLEINEDSMPGELSNVIAGRVANAFDLCGPNFTVDAACASSMAAIQAAVKALQSHDVDMCVTGGADRSMGVPTFTKFCKIGALSPNHSAPFDQKANGFVMAEGAGILILKRLSDARRDGDRVYSVIRGIGGSSDGKGKGITAPNPRGQKLALARAYEQAGIDPVEVDMMECHGTSTIVGDKVEVESLTALIGEGRRGDRGPVRIGSVKSNIGHLKSAAGAASCIKASLALFHKTFVPSINFEQARSDVPFDTVPLKVQTKVEPWPSGRARRVGISAFGFGGTNFHVVLEEDHGDTPVAVTRAAPVLPTLEDTPLPHKVWGVSAMDRASLITALESGANAPFDPSAPVRLAAAADNEATQAEQIERALKVLRKNGPVEMLRGRGIYVEEAPSDGKVAFLFTGQGSQYIDMGLDLAAVYPVVQATFDEANEAMMPELGRPLTDFIRRNPEISAEAQFERLRDTEISQPATLTVDIAIMRLLGAHGIFPDMVAGHSLGEYAAAVAAGILSFQDALTAVSARGREMAAVQIEDKGRMAGIAASVEKVQEVLAEIPGYVIPANKNCASQTVIAGTSEAVEAAIEAFVSRGITVYPLPVSHAFHSSIVAPASAPLKAVLERLDIQEPKRPITTNVTSRYYPTGEGARQKIIDTLAEQVASPVEWIAQVERMYADGARIFIECGPKRAISGFISSILKRRPHRSIYTNHPKHGGMASFQDALAALTTLGFEIAPEPSTEIPDLFAVAPPRIATSEAMRKWSPPAAELDTSVAPVAHATPFVVRAVLDVVAETTGYSSSELNLEDELEADLGIDTVKQAEVIAVVRDRFRLDHDPGFRLSQYRTLRDLANYAAQRLGATQPDAIERVLVDTQGNAHRTVDVASKSAPMSSGSLPMDTLSALAEGAARAGLGSGDANQFAASILPAVQGLMESVMAARPVKEVQVPVPTAAAHSVPTPATPNASSTSTAGLMPVSSIVCSGASVGLPGGTEVFAPDNVEKILDGEVRIRRLDEETQDIFVEKKVVRVHKDAKTGQGTFQPVTNREEVIRLAGVKAPFDLTEEYGIDARWTRALDITTQLAFGAGIEALRDAGIPMVRTYHETRSGKKVSTGWKLPEEMRDGTGVIFASAFPGLDKFASHIRNNGDDGEGNFDRRFLFQILSMGHSQFAQYIGARGPNAQANAACASTTQAVAMAADWIRLGRCERVVVIGADDVTNDTMIEWIGTGFLASGAATTKDVVEEAALPFDARRHGMILGMGAAGLVIEHDAAVAKRGMAPLGRLLSSRMANSAFHGTRLDPDHIAGEMDLLVAEAVESAGVDRSTFAHNAMFMSHETYTPAKGGSAAAEIESLRRAFGPAASKVVVTNTKGFTGHPMGAGIEDTIVLKALQYGRVPPIPNLKIPDPDLGDLTLSAGGAVALRYGIRLAAGFGSQLALLAWEKVAEGEQRITNPQRHEAWLRTASGLQSPELVVDGRHLRVVEGAHAVEPVEETAEPAATPVGETTVETPESTAVATPSGQVLNELLKVIGEKTGYGLDELEPEYELEADLGIDTVKQAEIFGQVREQYGLAPDENFRLSDYPTIETLAGWLASQVASSGGVPAETAAPTPPAPAAVEAPAPAAVEAPAPAAAVSGASGADVLSDLLAVISEKTGYAVDELDPEFELEADLGIDTVKQAEIFGQVREQYGLAPDENF
ncbi:MAG: beta-ketoacyl synthase N-terminal-like domain-containing protein, partial [Myxococcota bacterium]